MNLLTSIALSWLLFPVAASLLDFKWYGPTPSQSLHVNDLWVCQAITGIEGVLMTVLFHLNKKYLWPCLLGPMGFVWASVALFQYVFSPAPQGITNALIIVAIPAIQLLVASILAGSWHVLDAPKREP